MNSADTTAQPTSQPFTHLDSTGQARMVDVTEKVPTVRSATAAGFVRCGPRVITALRDGSTPKGDVLAVARIAGIQGAKKTADLRKLGLPLLDDNFEVCIQDQTHFPGKAVQDAMAGLTNLSLSVAAPTKEELEKWEAGSADLVANATIKLSKRVSGET